MICDPEKSWFLAVFLNLLAANHSCFLVVATIRNDYTVNGQDLNQDHSTAKIVVGVIAAGALVAALSRKSGSCETGPRGGTYTVTASGNKNYAGC